MKNETGLLHFSVSHFSVWSSSFIWFCLRLICASRYPESDTQTVPAINSDNRGSQIDQLFVCELRPGLFKHILRHMPFADQSDRLGPGQSGSFSVSVECRLSPRVESIEPLLGFPIRSRILCMHVNAKSATIDLRSASLDQFNQ